MKHSLLLAVTSLLLVACSTTQPTLDGDTSSSVSSEAALPQGNFGKNENGEFAGDLYVKGYVTTEEVGEPFCVENCSTFTYVYFQILESGDEDLNGFLGQNEGNAYVQPKSVGLGCVQNGQIFFVNDSDERRMHEETLSQDASDKILISSETKPVIVHLTRYPLSGGTEAPACYSHFGKIEVMPAS